MKQNPRAEKIAGAMLGDMVANVIGREILTSGQVLRAARYAVMSTGFLERDDSDVIDTPETLAAAGVFRPRQEQCSLLVFIDAPTAEAAEKIARENFLTIHPDYRDTPWLMVQAVPVPL